MSDEQRQPVRPPVGLGIGRGAGRGGPIAFGTDGRRTSRAQ